MSNKDSSTPKNKEPKTLDLFIEKHVTKRAEKEVKRLAGELRSAKARFMSEKFLVRCLSGAFYSIFIIICTFLGKWPTAALMAFMSWLASSEFFRMSRIAGHEPNEFLGLALAAFLPITALLPNISLPIFIIIFIIASGVWYVWTPPVKMSDLAITFFAPIYTGYFTRFIVLIRQLNLPTSPLPDWQIALLTICLLLSIWANDTFAYLIGSKFGKHKLAPNISPNKTWEGFFAGLIGSILVWVVLSFTNLLPINFFFAFASGLATGVVSIIGDLFESRLKREVGVKDSGTAIPGHGGMLDRIDSMLFASAIVYCILRIGGLA